MQIKTTMRYHLTQVRMAIIKKSTNHKGWKRYGGKETLLLCWWECKLVQPLWRTVWRFLKIPGIKLLYESTIQLLGTYPEKPITEKDICIPMFTAALNTTARPWSQPRWPPTDERIKLALVCAYTMEYHSAIKRNAI